MLLLPVSRSLLLQAAVLLNCIHVLVDGHGHGLGLLYGDIQERWRLQVAQLIVPTPPACSNEKVAAQCITLTDVAITGTTAGQGAEIETNTDATVLMATFVSKEIMDYAQYTVYLNTEYTYLHDYIHLIVNPTDSYSELVDDKRWNKVTGAIELLTALQANNSTIMGRKIKGLAIMDADLVILNQQLDIAALIDTHLTSIRHTTLDEVNAGASLLLCDDAIDVANTGFMLMRVTAGSLAFFQTWNASREQVAGVDQHVLSYLLTDVRYEQTVTIVPSNVFNSEWPTINTHNMMNNVIHLMGETNAYRLHVFQWMFEQYISSQRHGIHGCLSPIEQKADSCTQDIPHVGARIGLDPYVLQRLYAQLFSRLREKALKDIRNRILLASSNDWIDLSDAIVQTNILCDPVKRSREHVSDALCVSYYEELFQLTELALTHSTIPPEMMPPAYRVYYLKQQVVQSLAIFWFLNDATARENDGVGKDIIGLNTNRILEALNQLDDIATDLRSNDLHQFVQHKVSVLSTRRMSLSARAGDDEHMAEAINWGLQAFQVLSTMLNRHEAQRKGPLHADDVYNGLVQEYLHLCRTLVSMFASARVRNVREARRFLGLAVAKSTQLQQLLVSAEPGNELNQLHVELMRQRAQELNDLMFLADELDIS
jgi:hypothetical protein